MRRAAAQVPRGLAAVALALAAAGAAAQPAKAPVGIYTCTDNQGRRLTADRPIPQCAHKEQQLLNGDGSVRAVLPPTLTAEELSLLPFFLFFVLNIQTKRSCLIGFYLKDWVLNWKMVVFGKGIKFFGRMKKQH